MLLADALSHLPSLCSTMTLKLDVRIDHHGIITPRLHQLKAETTKKPVLSISYWYTLDGWPGARRHVPPIIRAYWDQRDTLSKDNGLLMKGQCIIIPTSNPHRSLRDLHVGHQGTTTMQNNAWLTVYWPCIDADIEDFDRCPLCLINRPSQAHETMHNHDVSDGPWKKIGVDFFDLNGQKYLVTLDYFSKYPHLIPVKNTYAVHTVNHLSIYLVLKEYHLSWCQTMDLHSTAANLQHLPKLGTSHM